MDSKTMHIVYASDKNYGPIMGISVISLLENNKSERICLHFLDGGIDGEDKRRIEELCGVYGMPRPHWMPSDDISRELRMKVNCDRGSLSQFARIFVSRHIDESIDRILSLDCDTIVRKSLRELWDLNLKDKTAAVLKDAFSKHYRANIALAPDDIIFNAGVMLIDLKRWRERDIEGRILDFIRLRRGFVEKCDQGALNSALSRDCLCFSPEFNAVTIFFDFTYREMLSYRKPPDYYMEEEVIRAAEDPIIVHYTASFLSKRPWMKNCMHPWAGEWLKYKEMSPWKDEPLSEEHLSLRVRIMRKLPRALMLRLAGLLQAYGRPWLYAVRRRRLERSK